MIKLTEKLKSLPTKPGVYLFKNSSGEVIYVGKAKNLRNRVKSYFLKNRGFLPQINILLKHVADFDYIIVSSEIESLILENNLIKQYQPRFNVRLRDDKNYQFIKIDYGSEIPQIYTVRKIFGGSHAKYFGPYTSGLAVKQTLKLLKRVFNLCANKKVSKKPCFYYHLGRCPGVCIGKLSLATYCKSLKSVEQFLNHKQTEILKDLKRQMREVSQKQQFEKAASLRDKIRSLENIWQKQKIVFSKPVCQDYFSLYQKGDESIVNLFVVREGKLIHQENFEVAQTEQNSESMSLQSFLKQYYADASDRPKEIFVSYELPEKTILEKWLKAEIIIPQRGKKLQLVKLGEENAQAYLEKQVTKPAVILQSLQTLLNLPKPPHRIEAYDISNIQGFLPVGSMVVFENGLPKKSDYRKFKINNSIRPSAPDGPNDFAMMREMLKRRFKHKKGWPLPSLIIIDGGKGQLGVAVQVLKAYSLRLMALGLAKRLEEIFVPGKKESIILPANSPILFLLQRIRDEAHRFAINFYRGRHRKLETHSILNDIPGVGPLTRKKLLQKFGSIASLRQASLEAIAREVGIRLASKIKERI